MTSIASRPSLLHTAIQDLRAGKDDAAKRLPALAGHVTDRALAGLLRDESARALAQAARLRSAGAETGARNLWMAGILDDAERDSRQIEPGPLLDIALIGAIRKAKAAEIVSSETALALAATTDQSTIYDAVEVNRAEEITADQALKSHLNALT